jgi:DNA-3-methyladenine glycosylase I (EC 3.2.2.20)
MFEFLVLESSQAGLSWITILRRRENYRKAFADFDVHKVAGFTEEDVERLMQDQGIIRNRRKIESTISNARCFIKVQEEFGSFCAYLRLFCLAVSALLTIGAVCLSSGIYGSV